MNSEETFIKQLDTINVHYDQSLHLFFVTSVLQLMVVILLSCVVPYQLYCTWYLVSRAEETSTYG